jgi:hypothetical protein
LQKAACPSLKDLLWAPEARFEDLIPGRYRALLHTSPVKHLQAFQSVTWSQLVTIQFTKRESVESRLLPFGHELLVDVQCGARTRVPRLRLRVLHVGASHFSQVA